MDTQSSLIIVIVLLRLFYFEFLIEELLQVYFCYFKDYDCETLSRILAVLGSTASVLSPTVVSTLIGKWLNSSSPDIIAFDVM